jgi:hypothetical protein
MFTPCIIVHTGCSAVLVGLVTAESAVFWLLVVGVEQLLNFCSHSMLAVAAGGLMVSAGGTWLCVWDVLGGGRLLKKLTNFQKTVTSVILSPCAGPASAAAPRMLAGSLDGHVKVWE